MKNTLVATTTSGYLIFACRYVTCNKGLASRVRERLCVLYRETLLDRLRQSATNL